MRTAITLLASGGGCIWLPEGLDRRLFNRIGMPPCDELSSNEFCSNSDKLYFTESYYYSFLIRLFNLISGPSKSNSSLTLKLNNILVNIKCVKLYLVELFKVINIYDSILDY